MQWFWRFAVLCGLLTGIVAASWTSPAGASETTQTANILGFNRNVSSQRGLPSFANQYVSLANDINPLVMSYEEVCFSQYEVLKAYLEALGWTGRWIDNINSTDGLGSWPSDSVTSEINRCEGRFGVAVFTKFYAGSGNVYQARYSPSNQVSTDPARRGYVCLRGVVYLRSWTVCGTHLTNKDDDVALDQLNGLFNFIYTWGSTGRIMLGDYNLNPGQVEDNTGAYGSYVEASQKFTPTTWSNQCGTGTQGAKIDFTFYRHLDGLSRGPLATLRDVCSDHRMIEGYFNFP